MALRLQWEEERYARIYCRDTLDWQCLSWNAQALWTQLNRKATRSGRIDLGRSGLRGVAALVGRPDMWPELEKAMAELLADGCVRHEGDALVIPDFVEAQEAVSSGAKRMRELRERRREEEGAPADGEGLARDEPSRVAPLSRGVGDETSPNVTRGYSTARTVQHGTAPSATPVPLGTVRGSLPATLPEGAALSASFAAELDAETTREERLRGRVLGALEGWRTIAGVATALRRSPNAIERDLLTLLRQGLVERGEQGSPPVMHWRCVPLGACEEAARAAAGGRS